MLLHLPAGPTLRQRAHLENCAAGTGAEQSHKPAVRPLTDDIDCINPEPLRELVGVDRLEWAWPPE
jgi:hypothetical protein